MIARVRTSAENVIAVRAEIDDLSCHLYGLDTADYAASDRARSIATDLEADEIEEEEAPRPQTPRLSICRPLGYAVGTIFGRWDIRLPRASGRRRICRIRLRRCRFARPECSKVTMDCRSRPK